MKRHMLYTAVLIAVVAALLASAGVTEVLLWEPFDYDVDTVLGSTDWYCARYNWAGNNGVVSNDMILDAGNYLKDTGAGYGASGYEYFLNKRIIGADEAVEFSWVQRRVAGSTAPEAYLYELMGGMDHGSATDPPKGKRYQLIAADGWGLATPAWAAQSLNLDTFPAEGSYVNANIPFDGTEGDTVDMKIVLTRSYASFHWRNHSADPGAWNLVTKMDGWGADSVQKVIFCLWAGTDVAYGFDSVKVEAVLVSTKLTGTVALEDYTGDKSLCNVNIELRDPSDGSIVASYVAALGNSGQYSVSDLPPGTYDVAFKASQWLQKVSPGVVLVDGEATSLDVPLSNGDINGDNSVGFADFNILRKNWGMEGD